MDNSNNIKTSVSVFVIVFSVVLVFTYFYQKMQHKDDSAFKFNWKKQSLVSLASASGAALITSLFLMCKEGKIGGYEMRKLRMGDESCVPCGMKQGMNDTGKMQLTRYRMSCGE